MTRRSPAPGSPSTRIASPFSRAAPRPPSGCRCSRSTRSRTRSSIESRRYCVDARELLRRYLEQRRDLGESELVLDSMSVDDALALLGAKAGAPNSHAVEKGTT